MKPKKPSKTTFAQRGSRLVLPIIGHSVSEVRLHSHALPVIIFRDEQGRASQIEFEAANICIVRGATEYSVAWNLGKPYAKEALMTFVELLNSAITDALAEKTGSLHLEFSNGFTLTATPHIYEGWHFRGSDLYLHGDDGRLI